MYLSKRKFYLLGMLIISLLLVSCQSSGMALFDLGQTFRELLQSLSDFVSNICDLSEEDLANLTRLLIAFLAFIIPSGIISRIGGNHGWGGGFGHGDHGLPAPMSIGISAFIAITTFLFIPAPVLLFVGVGYASIVAWILVFAPLIGGVYLWLRLREHLGAAHWLVLLVVCIGLLALYGWGAYQLSSVSVGC